MTIIDTRDTGHMSDDIERQVVEFIRGLNPANASVEPSTDLIASGLLDSLAILEVIAFAAQRFSATIPARKLTPANLRTPRAVTALIVASAR